MTIKVGQNMEVSLEARTGKVRMMLPFGDSLAITQPASAGPLNEAALAKLNAKIAGKESLSAEDILDAGLTFDQVNPVDGDFIYPLFRALSVTLIPGYYLDFTKDKVVEEAAPLMLGQTVYTNHYYWRIENWIGAVSQSTWDAKGEKTGGVPGINVELKIDWKMNPKIARGLLMKPPAIHSVSATIDFEWEASHPDLLEQGVFWRNLGLDVGGSIVRMIITKINRFYELSLVYQGANPESNGHLPADDEEELSALSANHGPQTDRRPSLVIDLNSKKETTKVKLTDPRKKALGLDAYTGEEVDDAIVLTAVDALHARATSADTIVAAARAEVLRLATLAEGVGEGDTRKLDPAIAGLIEKADASQLPSLTTLYQEKAQKAFPLTCKHGHPATLGRSSVEDPEEAKGSLAAEEEDTHLL